MNLPRPAAWRMPIDVIAGTRAVFERDFIVYTSQRRFIVMRTIAIALAAAITAAVLLGNLRAEAGAMGKYIMTSMAITVPALVLLLAPAMAASCISGERAVRTLDLVLAAPVTPASFVLAKFASRLATVLVIVFATLPVSALALLYGGVAPALFLEVYLFSTACAVLGVAAGVVSSAYSRGVAASVLRAYSIAILLPGLYVGLLVVAAIVLRNTGWMNSPDFEALVAPSPYGAWTFMIVQIQGVGLATGAVGAASGIMIGVSGVCLLLAMWRMGRESEVRTAPGRATKVRKSRVPLERPALARALRGSLLLRPTRATKLFTMAVLIAWGIVLWLVLEEGGNGQEWGHLGMLVSLTALLVLRVLATSPSHLAGARRAGSMALMLTSPVGPADVVHDEFAAAYGNMLPLLILGVLHAAVATFFGPLLHEAALAWLATTTVYIGLAAAIGLRIGATATSAGRAVLRTFAVFLGGSVLIGVAGIVVGMATNSMSEESMFWFGAAPVVTLVGMPLSTLGVTLSTGRDDLAVPIACGGWLILHGLCIPFLLRAAVSKLGQNAE